MNVNHISILVGHDRVFILENNNKSSTWVNARVSHAYKNKK